MHDENETARLRRSMTMEALGVDLVAGLAGDRELSAAEREQLGRQRARRGGLFFSDLLYAVTHRHFAPEVAEPLWSRIVEHAHAMAAALGRNPGIVVATLDHLRNVEAAPGALTLISERAFQDLAGLALRDGMTGLFNHSACYELLDLELRNHRRHGAGVSVLLLDVDDFKAFNDRGGQLAGDRVLVELATVLVDEARDSDICCRLGGDEFVIVLRRTDDPLAAGKLAERIRARASQIGSHGRRLAVRIGVASCDESALSPHGLIDKADRALRRAKAGGKDRVVVS